jgi:uncharacterized protein (TIGR00730 family)
MVEPAFSLCVYCGSRPGENAAFANAAEAVGQWIGRHNGQLVYGGGRSGLMGIVADATRQAGGRVVGVIPQSLVDRELANRLCDELHIVQTMHERKHLMAERANAFLALPGGIGTFEELFEVWTWRQLGYHDKPIGVLNTLGYYRRMVEFLHESVRAGFMSVAQMELLSIDEIAEPLLSQLAQKAQVQRKPSDLSRI